MLKVEIITLSHVYLYETLMKLYWQLNFNEFMTEDGPTVQNDNIEVITIVGYFFTMWRVFLNPTDKLRTKMTYKENT